MIDTLIADQTNDVFKWIFQSGKTVIVVISRGDINSFNSHTKTIKHSSCYDYLYEKANPNLIIYTQ